MQELHTSVRNLVEFILRSGDIDNRSGRMVTDAMMEGSKIHRKIQRGMGENYQAEVPLALTIEAEEYVLVIEGRADGVAYGEFPIPEDPDSTDPSLDELQRISENDAPCEMVYIDEIKGVYRNVATMEAPVYVHKAQAMCYAYIYALQNHLDTIGVQMTYCNLDTEDIRYFREVFTWDTLAEWFGNLIAEYRKWADWQIMWRKKRQASIRNLEFPYPYREGQKKLVGDVYRTISRGKNLFIQAPTGVGKTISTIFPAVKAVGEEKADRIFYLTAKTITATVAKETFGILREQGYQAKIIQLTAKEKLCLCGRTIKPIEENEQLTLFDDAESSVVDEALPRKNSSQNADDKALPRKNSSQNADDEALPRKNSSQNTDDVEDENEYPEFPQVKLECNPQNCPYAKGHFDRVNDAVFELLQESDFFTREEILAQAKKHRVCPFELSLDVATWCDNILCDYNYVFDPNVYLKRFFQDTPKEKYIFLVDEAHNLVDRSREMYSATLYKEDILAVKKIMKPHNHMIARTLDKCNKAMLDFKRECETYTICESVGVLTFHLMRLMSQMEEFFEKPREFPDKKTVLDFYFELRNFVNIYDLVDENYVIYNELQEDGRFMIKLFCVDPSKNLQKCIDKSVSTIFFSATLLPINYYKRLLSTKEDNYAIYAQSTFDEKQRLLAFGRDVSTKYTRRGPAEYERIAHYIHAAICGREGNYMVFFPSYRMMQDVCDVFVRAEQESGLWGMVDLPEAQCENEDQGNALTILMQHSNMNEAEREKFLQAFEQEKEGTLVAFCVMGGIFGEGIDLKNDRLIGAIIVGTGLPQISNEREILKQYYDKQGVSGFDYAFRYPGINKVLQAAGRVIRTQEDRGIIVLLDERFLQSDYDALYPREWKNRVVGNVEMIEKEISKFWEITNKMI